MRDWMDKRTGSLRTVGALHTTLFAAVIHSVVQLDCKQQNCDGGEGSATDPAAEIGLVLRLLLQNILGTALH